MMMNSVCADGVRGLGSTAVLHAVQQAGDRARGNNGLQVADRMLVGLGGDNSFSAAWKSAAARAAGRSCASVKQQPAASDALSGAGRWQLLWVEISARGLHTFRPRAEMRQPRGNSLARARVERCENRLAVWLLFREFENVLLVCLIVAVIVAPVVWCWLDAPNTLPPPHKRREQ